MDAAVISALAAVLGSVAGSSASIVTTWITQRNQTVRDRAKREVYKRELLYSEFVTEVARLTADAVDHSLDKPETLANVFGLLGRIRFNLLGASGRRRGTIHSPYRRPLWRAECHHGG